MQLSYVDSNLFNGLVGGYRIYPQPIIGPIFHQCSACSHLDSCPYCGRSPTANYHMQELLQVFVFVRESTLLASVS